MVHTLRIEREIPADRRVELQFPEDVPTGDVELVVVVVPKENRRRSTAQDLLNSEIVGMWADRTDISDSVEFARELREQAWKRGA